MTKNLDEENKKNSALNNRKLFLEQMRLSRLPSIPKRAAVVVPARSSVPAVCISCQQNLKNESAFARRISVCAVCLAIYNKITRRLRKRTRKKDIQILTGKKKNRVLQKRGGLKEIVKVICQIIAQKLSKSSIKTTV